MPFGEDVGVNIHLLAAEIGPDIHANAIADLVFLVCCQFRFSTGCFLFFCKLSHDVLNLIGCQFGFASEGVFYTSVELIRINIHLLAAEIGPDIFNPGYS